MFYRFVRDRLHRGPGFARANEQSLQPGLVGDLDLAAGPNRQQRAGSVPSSGLDAAFAAFRRANPTYHSTAKLDTLRATDYARLDREQQVYLDYTGGGLYGAACAAITASIAPSGTAMRATSADASASATEPIDTVVPNAARTACTF